MGLVLDWYFLNHKKIIGIWDFFSLSTSIYTSPYTGMFSLPNIHNDATSFHDFLKCFLINYSPRCILLLFQLDLKPSGRLQIQIRFFSENEGNFTWLSSCIWQQNVWRHEQIHVMHLVHFVSLCTVYIPYIHVWKEWKREKNYKHILFDVLHARMWIALAVLHY